MINSSFIYMTRYLSNVEKALLRLMLGFQQHPLAPPITVIFTPLVPPKQIHPPIIFQSFKAFLLKQAKIRFSSGN